MHDYQARPQVRYLAEASEEQVASIGPWTREVYREIGIDLDSEQWREQLQRAREQFGV